MNAAATHAGSRGQINALRVVVDNGSPSRSHRHCRLEAVDADLVPLWYSLPEIWRIRIRKLVRILPGMDVSAGPRRHGQ